LQVQHDLIYDVGANNGDDTAYYLSEGFRVLAVEADPTLMPSLRERFSAEIAEGRLTLFNVALAPRKGTAPFWICEGYSLWNSFDRAVASRDGRKCYAVELECWPLRDIFTKFGVPHYLKMSLHGHEHFCIADLESNAVPPYLSLELPCDLALSNDILTRLMTLGYQDFKIIDQTTGKQLCNSPPTLKSRVKHTVQKVPHLYRALEIGADRIRRLAVPERRASTESVSVGRNAGGSWVFPEGSSGPFGEQTDGSWRSAHEIRIDWKTFLSGDTDRGAPTLSVWHDLHARKAGSGGAATP